MSTPGSAGGFRSTATSPDAARGGARFVPGSVVAEPQRRATAAAETIQPAAEPRWPRVSQWGTADPYSWTVRRAPGALGRRARRRPSATSGSACRRPTAWCPMVERRHRQLKAWLEQVTWPGATEEPGCAQKRYRQVLADCNRSKEATPPTTNVVSPRS